MLIELSLIDTLIYMAGSLLFAFFIIPPAFSLVFAFWFYVMCRIEEYERRRYAIENPPCCDIDPECHPGFVWGSDGVGRIGPYVLHHKYMRKSGQCPET